MRLFLALELPREIRNGLNEMLAGQRERFSFLRWTSPENLHVTLRFLGDLNPSETADKLRKLNPGSFLPVEYTLFRTGTFGSPPRILWVSGRFSPSVNRLASVLGEIPDERGDNARGCFIPHITVARAPRGSSLPSVTLSGEIKGFAGSLTLFNSTLTSAGPVYERFFQVSR